MFLLVCRIFLFTTMFLFVLKSKRHIFLKGTASQSISHKIFLQKVTITLYFVPYFQDIIYKKMLELKKFKQFSFYL